MSLYDADYESESADDATVYLCADHGIVRAQVIGGHRGGAGCGLSCGWCGEDNAREYRCPECGNEPKSFGKGIEFIDGRLYELGTQPALPRNPATAPSWLKQKWYSQILCYAELRGYKMGWVSHTYRDKFGVWPRGLSSKVEQPGKEVMAHIQKKIMQYKYMQRGQGATGNA